MAGNDNSVRNILSWQVDRSALESTVQANKRIGESTAAAAKRGADAFSNARRITSEYDGTLGKLGATASASLTILEQKMRDGARTTASLKREVDQTGKEYDDLSHSADRAATSTRNAAASGGGGSSVLATARSAAGTAGGVLSTVGGGQAASAVSSILGLSAQLGPVGLVAGVTTVAFAALQQEMENNKQAAEDYANQLKSNADLVAGGATTSDVQAQVQRLQTARSFAADELSELADFKEQITGVIPGAFDESAARIGNAISRLQGDGNTQLFDNFNTLLAEISTRSGQEIQTVAQLDAYIASVQATTDAYGTQIANLNRVLASGALDAATAEEAQRQLSALYRELDQVYLDSAQAVLEAERLTSEQRDERISEIQAEVDSYRALIASGTLHGDTITELEAKISQLTVRQEAYASVVKSTGDAVDYAKRKQEALEQTAKTAAERTDMLFAAMDREGTARTKALELEGKISETVSARAREEAEETTASANKISAIEADAAADREKVVQDSQDRIGKLTRDAGREQAQAVGARDEDAYRQSRLRTKDAYDDQTTADKRRLDDITANAGKSVAVEQVSARARVRAIEDGADRTVAELRAQVNEQNRLAQSARDSQVFLAANTASSVIGQQSKMYSDMNTLAFNAGRDLPTSFANGLQSALGGRAGGFLAPSSVAGGLSQGGFDKMFDQRFDQYLTAASTGGRASLNRAIDQRFVQIKTAARGGRTLTT